jgi:hypothetical protein
MLLSKESLDRGTSIFRMLRMQFILNFSWEAIRGIFTKHYVYVALKYRYYKY